MLTNCNPCVTAYGACATALSQSGRCVINRIRLRLKAYTNLDGPSEGESIAPEAINELSRWF